MRQDGPPGAFAVSTGRGVEATLDALDAPTCALVKLAAVLTVGSEPAVAEALASSAGEVPDAWCEELILQTCLFAGFPRALNAMREWRRISGRAAPVAEEERGADSRTSRKERGERVCGTVYGTMYGQLREHVRALHPALDAWMVEDGYGRVLAREGLDLARRELCIVAACVASGQERQLQAHLHGAMNAGVSPGALDAALQALDGWMEEGKLRSAQRLWSRVRERATRCSSTG